MNLKCSIFVLLFPVFIFSQEKSILEDTIPNNSNFIQDFSNQLNIKFDVTNDRVSYFIPFESRQAEVRSNLNISYGLVFSYKFLSVRLGFRPKLSEAELENKGKTDRFRIRIKFLLDNWIIDWNTIIRVDFISKTLMNLKMILLIQIFKFSLR